MSAGIPNRYDYLSRAIQSTTQQMEQRKQQNLAELQAIYQDIVGEKRYQEGMGLEKEKFAASKKAQEAHTKMAQDQFAASRADRAEDVTFRSDELKFRQDTAIRQLDAADREAALNVLDRMAQNQMNWEEMPKLKEWAETIFGAGNLPSPKDVSDRIRAAKVADIRQARGAEIETDLAYAPQITAAKKAEAEALGDVAINQDIKRLGILADAGFVLRETDKIAIQSALDNAGYGSATPQDIAILERFGIAIPTNKAKADATMRALEARRLDAQIRQITVSQGIEQTNAKAGALGEAVKMLQNVKEKYDVLRQKYLENGMYAVDVDGNIINKETGEVVVNLATPYTDELKNFSTMYGPIFDIYKMPNPFDKVIHDSATLQDGELPDGMSFEVTGKGATAEDKSRWSEFEKRSDAELRKNKGKSAKGSQTGTWRPNRPADERPFTGGY